MKWMIVCNNSLLIDSLPFCHYYGTNGILMLYNSKVEYITTTIVFFNVHFLQYETRHKYIMNRFQLCEL